MSAAFTRGSVIFIALLTTCLDAFGEVGSLSESSLSSLFLFVSIDADANDWPADFAEAGKTGQRLSIWL
jgi:hypothetical protein